VFSTDPGEFFGDSRCTGLDVIVCEDFEAGSVPVGAIWEQSSWPRPGNAGEPQIRVDGVHTARGQGALHLTVDDGSEAYLSTSAPFPAPGNTFYGRVFFYVESPVPQQDYTVHWNLVEALGPAMQGAESYTSKIRYGGTYNPFNEGYIFNVEAQPRPSGFNEFGTGDGHGLEENEWVCVEWMFGDGPEGRLWRNGVEVPELHVGSPVDGVSYEMPPFDAVKIGWAIYQQVDVPFEVWIDEIALDHERIGCQR
jgi:hypothetical protein